MMAKESIQSKILPIMVIVLIGAAFALGMMWGKIQVYEKGNTITQAEGGIDQVAAPAPTAQLSEDDQKSLLVDPAYAFGDEDAPVTLVEFTDYECPFCKRYIDETSGTIISDYVDSGKVRYVIRDLPLAFHSSAKPAAIAARCAGDQEKYLEMHDLIFAGQADWTTGDAGGVFKGYASDLGLNTSTFNSCLDNQEHSDVVDADSALAAKLGATGTPSFFVNGTILVGAQPISAFEAAIEAALDN